MCTFRVNDCRQQQQDEHFNWKIKILKDFLWKWNIGVYWWKWYAFLGRSGSAE